MKIGREGLEWLKESVTEGKMIRGMLVLIGAHVHGLQIEKQMYTVAASIELIHTAFLIHDDIIDNDYRRRGQDSLYYRYIKEGYTRNVADPEKYGMSMAMCLGDMIFFLAHDLISRNIHDPLLLSQLVRLISEETQHIGPAQMMDTSFAFNSDEPGEEEIEQVYTYKTAHYTFSLPLMLGSAFSVQPDFQILKNIGYEMGIIFQLRDDELGIFGSSEQIGKPIGADIRENKKTYIRHLLVSSATVTDQNKLKRIFGNPDLTSDDIACVRQMIDTYNIRRQVNAKVADHQKRLSFLFKELRKAGKETTLLEELSEYIATRES